MRGRFRKSQRGFTLIEVLIAVVIMAGGIMVMANAWSGNFLRVRNSRVNNTAASLLERKMTEIEILYKDKPLEEIKETDAGDFGAMFPGYAWEITAKEFEMPDLSSGLVSRDEGADEMLLTIVKTMTEFIKKSVKEVSVTVSFKPKKGNELHHTVTTYFVDYTKDIDMPGMPGGAAAGTAGGATGGAAGGTGTGGSATGTGGTGTGGGGGGGG